MNDQNKKTPFSMDDLVKQYQSAPIVPLEFEQIFDKLEHDLASVQHFKVFYDRDPLFCSYLVDFAWQTTKKKDNHPFAADHAMSIIGISNAKKHLKIFSKLAKPELSQEVKFLLTSSLLAGELAKNLCSDKSKGNRLYWLSMAHQFPDIILWNLIPKQMWKIQYHQTKQAHKIEAFDRKVLGFTRSEWRQRVAEVWHMAEGNEVTFKKPPPNNARELVRYSHLGYCDKTSSLESWHNTDSWQILCANWLAKSLIAPWLGNSYHHYFLIAKNAFNISENQLKKMVGKSLRLTSEKLADSQLFVPASCFLHLHENNIYPKWLTQPAAAQQNKPTFNLKKFLAKLHNSPQDYSSAGEMLSESFKAITLGLGFSRVAFIAVNWRTKLATTKISVGRSDTKERLSIRPEFELEKAASLRKFLTEKMFLVFNIKVHEKHWPKLPLAIRQQNIKKFALYSVMPKERVKALIYVDGKDIVLGNPMKIKQLKLILNGVNKALAISSPKRNQKTG